MIPTLIFLLLTTFSTTDLHGAEENQIIKYKEQCKIIQETFKNEKNNFCEMIYNKQLDPAQELARIEQQFTYHKEKLEAEKNASLLQLKNLHNISDDDWKWCIHITDEFSEVVKHCINTFLPDASHDSIISGKNKMIFAKHLLAYGLNIQKIDIKKGQAFPMQPYKQNVLSLCQVAIESSQHPIDISVDTASITFSPYNYKKGDLAVVAREFANISCIIPGLTYSILKKSNKNYTVDELMQSCEYRHFLITQSKYVQIVPSLEDYEACKWITKTRSYTYSEDIENKYDHFQQLCTIKNLWEKRKILQELVQK